MQTFSNFGFFNTSLFQNKKGYDYILLPPMVINNIDGEIHAYTANEQDLHMISWTKSGHPEELFQVNHCCNIGIVKICGNAIVDLQRQDSSSKMLLMGLSHLGNFFFDSLTIFSFMYGCNTSFEPLANAFLKRTASLIPYFSLLLIIKINGFLCQSSLNDDRYFSKVKDLLLISAVKNSHG